MSKRWTYQVLELKPSGAAGMFSFGFNAAQLQEALVRQGQQGWELVNVTALGNGTKVAVFKREL